MRKLFLSLAVLCALAAPLRAQPADCSDGGVHYDSGSFSSGAGWQFGFSGEYVMRIDPPTPFSRVDAACLCWQRTGTGSQVFFDVNVWAADGPNGGPGTLLGKIPTAQASGVGTFSSWYRYDLSGLGITAAGPVYIGPRWSPNDNDGFFVCMDEASPVSQPAFGGADLLDGEAPSSALGRVGFFPTYRALGIRAKFGASTATCTSSDTALCLNKGRFKVEATFTAPGQPQGMAHVVKLTDETGYLWFFSATNVETVVKVLDACSYNQKFWVYAGGLTNVQVTLNVTDTQNGTVKTYTNPQGKAFQPIQDTSAFATCH